MHSQLLITEGWTLSGCPKPMLLWGLPPPMPARYQKWMVWYQFLVKIMEKTWTIMDNHGTNMNEKTWKSMDNHGNKCGNIATIGCVTCDLINIILTHSSWNLGLREDSEIAKFVSKWDVYPKLVWFFASFFRFPNRTHPFVTHNGGVQHGSCLHPDGTTSARKNTILSLHVWHNKKVWGRACQRLMPRCPIHVFAQPFWFTTPHHTISAHLPSSNFMRRLVWVTWFFNVHDAAILWLCTGRCPSDNATNTGFDIQHPAPKVWFGWDKSPKSRQSPQFWNWSCMEMDHQSILKHGQSTTLCSSQKKHIGKLIVITYRCYHNQYW